MSDHLTIDELREVAELFVALCDAPANEKVAILGGFERFPADKFANHPWVDPPSIHKTSSAKRKYRDHVASWLDGRHSDPARIEKMLRSTAILNLAGEITLEDDFYEDDIIHRDRTTQMQHLHEHEEWSLSLRYVDRSTCATKGCETVWLHLGDVRAYADDLEADGWRLVTAKGGKYLAHDSSLAVVRVQNASARHCCDTHRKLSSANPDGKTRTIPIKESTRQTYEKELVQDFKNTYDPFQNSLG
ncbi:MULTISPECIES: hypothetical protein [unclassified Exiguobacterium]|uniref:hypothetical protein n=1 Tax=unclassified Exiguobacterium TaxID=2644629 RepID=UPI001BECEC9D|nr:MULTISPECIES: hypothetical protein [unclassified Exiguobacterium]